MQQLGEGALQMQPLSIHGQGPQLVQLSQPQQQVRVISAALVHQLQAQGLTASLNKHCCI